MLCEMCSTLLLLARHRLLTSERNGAWHVTCTPMHAVGGVGAAGCLSLTVSILVMCGQGTHLFPSAVLPESLESAFIFEEIGTLAKTICFYLEPMTGQPCAVTIGALKCCNLQCKHCTPAKCCRSMASGGRMVGIFNHVHGGGRTPRTVCHRWRHLAPFTVHCYCRKRGTEVKVGVQAFAARM